MGIATRGAKPAISYSALHNLSNIYSEKKKKQAKKATGRFLEAERIIERRNGRESVCMNWF
jgi:hypothetical protein